MDIDYKKLQLKVGIELHQQLNVGKLFCRCPSLRKDVKPDFIFMRKIRPVAGELGLIDSAALFEFLKEKRFIYYGYKDCTCEVECDETPPMPINYEALKLGLAVVLLFNGRIENELHVMRKTVSDGSVVSGFQRTILLSNTGYLTTSKDKIKITGIYLEEDAARKIKEENGDVIFSLDRLGIPLIEISTDIIEGYTPEEIEDVVHKIGMMLRSFKDVARGIGTIRQDINISIKGVSRVEIKGIQDISMIPEIIENEIKRQQDLIERGEKPKEETRVAKEDGTTVFTRPLPGGERLYPETDLETIIIDKEILSKIKTPETWEEKSKRFRKILPKEMIDQILRSEYLDLFEKYSKENDPVLVANTFISILKDLRRRGFETETLSEEQFNELFFNIKKKIISKEAIPNILEIVCKQKVSIKEAIEKSGLKALSEEQLRKIIKEIFRKYPNLVKEKKSTALMGEVMKEVRGRIPGKIVSKILNEELNNTLT